MGHRLLWSLLALLTFGAAGRAQETVAITGSVVDVAGALIPDARISLEQAGQIRTTSTNGAGEFEFNIPPGEYALVVSAQGFRSRRIPALRVTESGAKLDRLWLTIAPIPECSGGGELADPHLFFMAAYPEAPDEPVIRGWVTEDGVELTLTDEHRQVVARTRSIDARVFEFFGVPPGFYSLRASLRGHEDFVIPRLEVRADTVTVVQPALEMVECPAGARARKTTRSILPPPGQSACDSTCLPTPTRLPLRSITDLYPG